MANKVEPAKKDKPKICVVLGGNGFIGSHVVDELAQKDGVIVRAFDMFFNEQQFNKAKNVKVIKGSAFDYELLDKVLEGANYVVNCLAASNPFISDSDPYADLSSLKKTIEIFERCVKAGVKKVVFISSGGAVYGQLTEIKTAKEMDAPMPVSPYGIAKLATEHYLEYFKRKHNMDYVVCRLTNPYGPRQPFRKEHGVIPAFMHNLLNDKPITIFGDGHNSRDYIFIKDAAAMIVNLLFRKTKHTTYNIGSGRQTSLNDILKTMESIFKKKAEVKRVEAPKTFLKKTDVSTRRYMNEFGRPQLTSFRRGLQVTLNNLKEKA